MSTVVSKSIYKGHFLFPEECITSLNSTGLKTKLHIRHCPLKTIPVENVDFHVYIVGANWGSQKLISEWCIIIFEMVVIIADYVYIFKV